MLVTDYMIAVATIFNLSGDDQALLWYLDLPMALPKALFFYFVPPTAEDFSQVMTQRKVLMTIFFYIANTLLYAIPVYILLTVISRKRRGVAVDEVEPPRPPSLVR